MSKKEVKKIAHEFQKKIQAMVDKSPHINSVSIEVGSEKIVIAQKKPRTEASPGTGKRKK